MKHGYGGEFGGDKASARLFPALFLPSGRRSGGDCASRLAPAQVGPQGLGPPGLGLGEHVILGG
jgi:hypothetical protein